jgi:hypothetical protein
MKNRFQQIINRLFTASFCSYSNNMDDTYEGFEFNPNDPRILVRLLYNIQYEGAKENTASLRIDKYSIIPYDSTVIYKNVISGHVILLPDGEIDFNFYETILKNLSNF